MKLSTGFKISPLKALYANYSVRQFALNLYGLFGPIYVASLFGFGTFGIITALVFYIIFRVTMIAAILPASLAIEIHGFRRCMLFSNVLAVLYFLLLHLSKSNLELVFAAPFVGGLLVPFYWLPYHLIVSEDSEDAWFGKEVGTLKLISRSSEVLAPVIGGLIIAFLGYSSLFLVIVLLFILSFIPLSRMPRHLSHKTFKFRELVEGVFCGERAWEWVSLFAAGGHDMVESLVWVFIMFAILGGEKQLGLLKSVSTILMVLTVLIAGRIMDKSRKAGKLLIFSSRVDSVLWVGRFFIRSLVPLAVSEFIVRVSRGMLWTPFDAIMYHKARNSKKGAFFYLLRREYVLNLGRLTALILILILVASGIDLYYGVFIGALASFMLAPPKRGVGGWWTRGDSNS